MMLRHAVQFHWSNAGYATFDEFLAALNHEKRKKIRQDRRKVSEAGITFEWREGRDIAERDWAFFNRCYRQTYREHHSTPYLTLDFFVRIGRVMPQNLLLVLALRAGKPIASSLFVRHGSPPLRQIVGHARIPPRPAFRVPATTRRSSTASRAASPRFEGGARGEHKMARGLMPVETCSAHWLARPEFARAIEQFLARESRGIERYVDELNERSPFRRTDGAAPNEQDRRDS